MCCILAWINDKGRFKSGGGNFTAQESKAVINCIYLRQMLSNLLQYLWTNLLHIDHGSCSSTARKMLYCILLYWGRCLTKQAESINFLPLSTIIRLCSTSIDEILIWPVREWYPQSSPITDLPVQTLLFFWELPLLLTKLAKLLYSYFPLPLLELKTSQSYNDLLKPVLLSKNSGKQKLY